MRSRDNVQYYNLCIFGFYDLTVLYKTFLFFFVVFGLLFILFFLVSVVLSVWFKRVQTLDILRSFTVAGQEKRCGLRRGGETPSLRQLWSFGHFRKEEKFYPKEATQQPVQKQSVMK